MNNLIHRTCCDSRIGRADIEESKSNVDMNSWPPQASSQVPLFSQAFSFLGIKRAYAFWMGIACFAHGDRLYLKLRSGKKKAHTLAVVEALSDWVVSLSSDNHNLHPSHLLIVRSVRDYHPASSITLAYRMWVLPRQTLVLFASNRSFQHPGCVAFVVSGLNRSSSAHKD